MAIGLGLWRLESTAPKLKKQDPQWRNYATLQQEINTLSAKYKVSSSLATRIIYCESHNDPLAVRLNYRGGLLWSRDIGYWQINTYWQEADLAKQGFNIHDPLSNLEAGFWLLKHEGTAPWAWSRGCWN